MPTVKVNLLFKVLIKLFLLLSSSIKSLINFNLDKFLIEIKEIKGPCWGVKGQSKQISKQIKMIWDRRLQVKMTQEKMLQIKTTWDRGLQVKMILEKTLQNKTTWEKRLQVKMNQEKMLQIKMIWEKWLLVKMNQEKMLQIKMIWEKRLSGVKYPHENLRKTKRTKHPVNYPVKKTRLPIQQNLTPPTPIPQTQINQTRLTQTKNNKTIKPQPQQPTKQKKRTKHQILHKLNKNN